MNYIHKQSYNPNQKFSLIKSFYLNGLNVKRFLMRIYKSLINVDMNSQVKIKTNRTV